MLESTRNNVLGTQQITTERKDQSMKLIRLIAAGMLIIGLFAVAYGGSYYMTGTTAAVRPEKTYDDYMRAGSHYYDSNEYAKAIVSYENALSLQSNDTAALKGIARSYARQGNYAKEYETRKHYAEVEPEDLDNRIRIIELMISMGDLQLAKTETEELMDKNDSEDLRSLYREMTIETPVFNLKSGSYDEYQLLELNNVYNNAVVHYTLDGSEPTLQSPAFTDGLVISYPETEFRAKAFGVLGYSSDEAVLSFSITRPPQEVFGETVEEIAREVFHKSGREPVFDYELAQIRELYLVGYYLETGPVPAVFYNGSYKVHDLVYTDRGFFTLDFAPYTPFLKTLAVCCQEKLELSQLSSLSKLENLSLLNNDITDIGPLKDLKSLKSLALGWNSISDVSPLSELTSLETLGLWNNQVQDISGLEGLKDLVYLDIAYNQVEKIDIVSNMRKLKEVWINNNRIEDISPLSDCKELIILIQNGNPISDYSVLRDLAAQLYKCDIRWEDVQ